ncbi:MBL fold metallo-hydrolase [Herbidospora cretacea]|uniref:MBL fold metallo-hydrolase n=1 Tax=Herbidospora cretacea TaxID=28444 RepID=UPI00077301A7|nr:MBL fold metallo-hydrolase [Herbidospora cretacea]
MSKRASEQNLPRREGAATVLGGPTTVIDMGGLRIVVDPTFDDPGPHGYLTKTLPPVADEAALGPVDVVLVSHDAHPDNLDDRGRAFAQAAPLTLTVPGTAARLNGRGLEPWTTFTVLRPDGGGDLFFLAVPAVHGPEDGERDADGFVNCEVTGFVLSGRGLPTVYVSGDNASMRVVGEIARGVPEIDAAVLNAGAARVQGKFRQRPVSMDGRLVAAAAAVLGADVVIPAHYDGWTHFTEGRAEVEKAFDEAGLSSRLRAADHGTWSDLRA